MVGVEEGGVLVQHGAVLVVLVLLRVEHLLLQLPHDLDDLLPLPDEAALCAPPLRTVQTSVRRKDGTTTVLAEASAEVGPQLGGILTADTGTLEEPAGLDIRAPDRKEFFQFNSIFNKFYLFELPKRKEIY